MTNLSLEELETLRRSFREKVAGDDLDGAKKVYQQIRKCNSTVQNLECKRQIEIMRRRRIGPVQGVGPQGYTRPKWIGSRKPVDRVAARVVGRRKK